MKTPLVTVYIPTFNRIDLLERAIKSVLSQSYQHIEVIVVDDCSTDGTDQFLSELSKADSRVRYFLKEKNSGACASRNIAINHAKGEFITGLDDDDYFSQNRIQNFVSYWFEGKSKNAVILYSSYTIKKNTNEFVKRPLKKKKVSFDDVLKINDIGNQVFTEVTTLRSALFDTRLPMWQDFKCWLDILNITNGIAEGLNNYSYVVDKSHPHERISNKSIEKLAIAENVIKDSFELNSYQLLYLKNHKTGYGYALNFLQYLKLILKPEFDLLFKLRLIKQLLNL